MKNIIFKSVFLLLIAMSIFSCKKDEIVLSPLDGLTKLQEGYALGAATKVQIWGTKNFYTGYNQLTLVLLDSINPADTIKDAHIHLKPTMAMAMMSPSNGKSNAMGMTHACPVENPTGDAVRGMFKGAVAFIMPSADGTWKLGISIHNHKTDKEGDASFDITVDSPTYASLSVFTSQSADSSKLVLSMVQPLTPKVGLNDIEFTLHRKLDMMQWPADSTHTIEFTPEMPSMGHGSPNNVNPTHVSNGHYKGKVNFTMTGEWKINVLVKKDGTTVSKDAYFNIKL